MDSLCCARCHRSFHGECLSIDNSLLQFLHVVVDIGGWCCRPCCGSNPFKHGKTGIRDELNDVKTQVGAINDNITAISLSIQSLTSLVNHSKPTYAEAVLHQKVASGSSDHINIPRHPLVPSNSNHEVTNRSTPQRPPGNHPGNDTIHQGSKNNEFRTAVLTAVHSELKTQTKRSSNIVVPGLKLSREHRTPIYSRIFASRASQSKQRSSRQLDWVRSRKARSSIY